MHRWGQQRGARHVSAVEESYRRRSVQGKSPFLESNLSKLQHCEQLAKTQCTATHLRSYETEEAKAKAIKEAAERQQKTAERKVAQQGKALKEHKRALYNVESKRDKLEKHYNDMNDYVFHKKILNMTEKCVAQGKDEVVSFPAEFTISIKEADFRHVSKKLESTVGKNMARKHTSSEQIKEER